MNISGVEFNSTPLTDTGEIIYSPSNATGMTPNIELDLFENATDSLNEALSKYQQGKNGDPIGVTSEFGKNCTLRIRTRSEWAKFSLVVD